MRDEKKMMRLFCPVCGEEKKEEFFFRDFSGAAGIVPFLSYKVCGCPKCGMMYASALTASQYIDEYYAKMSRYEGKSFVLSDKVKSFYERVADFISVHASDDSKILDIGCAFGGLLSELKAKGFAKLYGLEPSARNAKYARDNYGIQVINSGLGMGYVPFQKYDFVILSGVLEHLVDLHNTLEEIKCFLKPNGKLFFVVPDLDDFANHADLYQEFSVEHINYFNSDSLSTLLGKHSFKLKECIRDTVPMHGLCRNLFALFELNEETIEKYNPDSSFKSMDKYLNVSKQITEIIERKIKAIPVENGCYIWGAGTQTQMLFQLGWMKKSYVRMVVDSNVNYHGESFYDRQIVSPDMLIRSEVLPILISSQYAQTAIEKQIKSMNLKNEVWKLF